MSSRKCSKQKHLNTNSCSSSSSGVENKTLEKWQYQMQLEQITISMLLKIEQKIRSYYALYSNETKKQREIIAELWELGQRYAIATDIDSAGRFPEAYHKTTTEDVLLVEFNAKYQNLRESNNLLNVELQSIRCNYVTHFKAYSTQLDATMNTPFVAGDAYHKPSAYFVELIDDLISYLYSVILKLIYHCQLLEPVDLDAIDVYKALLNPNEDFEEYLLIGLAYCKCLQAKEVAITKIETETTTMLSLQQQMTPPTRRICYLLKQAAITAAQSHTLAADTPGSNENDECTASIKNGTS